jgi:hypothetical protein
MKLLDLRFPSTNELRAVFGFSYPRTSQVSLSIRLNTEVCDMEKIFDEIRKLIDVVRYCHDYEHCQECNWRQLMAIVNRCRAIVPLAFSTRAVTIKIRDQVISELAKEDVFLENNLVHIETGNPARLWMTHSAVAN